MTERSAVLYSVSSDHISLLATVGRRGMAECYCGMMVARHMRLCKLSALGQRWGKDRDAAASSGVLARQRMVLGF